MFNVVKRDETFLHDIIRKNPQCLRIQSNIFKNTPVMVAMKHRINDVHTLLRLDAQSFTIRNSKNENPLHILCIYKQCRWWDTVKTIIEVHPELLYQKDNRGKTPIDYGCEDIGAESYQAAKEFFLTNCLRVGPINRKHWETFIYPVPSLVPILGTLVLRSKEEAGLAMKYIRKKTVDRIRETLMMLHKLPVRLEPEHVQAILLNTLCL